MSLKTIDGLTPMQPIHLAAKLGSARMVNFLADKGADIEQLMSSMGGERQDTATTPLCIGAREGHLNVVEALVKRGAKMKCDTRDEAPLLHHAVRSTNLEVVRFLLDQGVDASLRCNSTECKSTDVDPIYKKPTNVWAQKWLASDVATYWGLTKILDLLKTPKIARKKETASTLPSAVTTHAATEIANLTHAEFHSK